ncbi:serine and arginine rich splicing factor 5b isoform X2 [Danio rerio]|uniref:Serine and arginine rich splicing factor 5b isoform X1 n=1 Tax=Danio rerio TaxID=7955 RepID=Q4V988_DANRE|nr:splicing factor, arginine/serine-rich 5 isoform X2 [Danio rerio]AAH97003.1 Sfrs5b protein [Danio rerio]|eukprot:XP_005160725.1 splicing factor, arginine/serine-rich 5 isoform X2 [Danio rerio]
MSGCRIFIGRLNPSAREKDVERFFKGYGRIRDIDLKRGFGFVEFDDPRDAEDAVYELDGKELCNERVTIEHARVRLRGGRGRGGGGRFPARYGRGSQDSRRNPPPMRTENRLIVENLSSRVSWQPDCCVVWKSSLMVELSPTGSLSLLNPLPLSPTTSRLPPIA